MRACKECGEEYHWQKMEAHNETKYKTKGAAGRAGTSAEKDDVKRGIQSSKFTFTCNACVCVRDGVEPHVARRNIKQPRTQRGLERCRAFKQAMEHIKLHWTFLLIGAETNATDVEGKPESDESEPKDLWKWHK